MEKFKMNNSQRINHVLLGSALIIITMSVNITPLGWLAVLPLFATYPIFTALIGYDPLTRGIEETVKQLLHFSPHAKVKHLH